MSKGLLRQIKMLEPELAPTPPPEPKPPAEESWSRETALSAVQLGGDTKRGVTPRQLKRRMKDEEQRRRRATRARCGAPWPMGLEYKMEPPSPCL
jgi:hypothetical protein